MGCALRPDISRRLAPLFVAGRDFVDDDVRTGRRSIVIDDTLAARAFGSSEAAIGRTLQLERERTPESQFEVIGVVRHIRYHDLRRPMLPQIYQAGLIHAVQRRSAGERRCGVTGEDRRDGD